MLSILIPVYNWDIRALVRALQAQAEDAGIPYEIICLDDASLPDIQQLNREIASLSNICYEALPANIGRAAIRNRLAARSRFPFLLFMDADSGIVRDDYLQRYLEHCAEDAVLTGGTVYLPDPPDDPALRLRWLYGVHREQHALETRQTLGWAQFATHHFVVPRQVFVQLSFEEKLRHYGHEDTLFGIALQQAGYRIVHLDNPLLHLGLEPAAVFLEKVESSVRNLALLQDSGQAIPSRLWETYVRLRKSGLHRLLAMIFPLLAPLMRRNLLGKQPDLMVLDVYKLAFLCRLQASRTLA